MTPQRVVDPTQSDSAACSDQSVFFQIISLHMRLYPRHLPCLRPIWQFGVEDNSRIE
jgi:hypothetical protein